MSRTLAANKQQIQANMGDIQENTDRFSLSEYDVGNDCKVRCWKLQDLAGGPAET
jgi:hypothetical protein